MVDRKLDIIVDSHCLGPSWLLTNIQVWCTWSHTMSSNMIDPGFKPHLCLLAGVEENDLTAMRSAGVRPEVNLREYVTCTPPPSTNKAARSCLETQKRYHQKSKAGVSMAPQKGLTSSKNFFKKQQNIQVLHSGSATSHLSVILTPPDISLFRVIVTDTCINLLVFLLYYLDEMWGAIRKIMENLFWKSFSTRTKSTSRLSGFPRWCIVICPISDRKVTFLMTNLA